MQSTTQRYMASIGMGAPLAAIIIGAMATAVLVEEIIIAEPTPYLNVKITPDIETYDPPPRRTPVKRLEAPKAPPPIEPIEAKYTPADVPVTEIIYEPQTMRPDVVSIPTLEIAIDAKAQPLQPLKPVYPRRAQDRGLEGSCDVMFDISTLGEALNPTVNCSNTVFENSALKAIRRAKYTTAKKNGQPIVQRGAFYKIEYNMPQ